MDGVRSVRYWCWLFRGVILMCIVYLQGDAWLCVKSCNYCQSDARKYDVKVSIDWTSIKRSSLVFLWKMIAMTLWTLLICTIFPDTFHSMEPNVYQVVCTPNQELSNQGEDMWRYWWILYADKPAADISRHIKKYKGSLQVLRSVCPARWPASIKSPTCPAAQRRSWIFQRQGVAQWILVAC